MQKPDTYFYALLQAKQSVSSQAGREVDERIIEHLDNLYAEVDYSYVDPDNAVATEEAVVEEVAE